MTQDPGTDSSFHVDAGESVTVTVTPVHCANLSVAGFKGVTKNQTPPNSGIYIFTVDGTSADTATVPFKFVCRCGFLAPPAGTPPTAPLYSVTAEGEDGTTFNGPTIHISLPEVTFALNFRIN
jgi:hypothetical protein